MDTLDQAHDETNILGLFLDPPGYSLPEELRQNIRDMIAYQDAEWAVRHPDCDMRKTDLPDSNMKWGDDCLGCFTTISAMETVGRVETVIALHRAMSHADGDGDSCAVSVQKTIQSLTALLNSFEQLAAVNWTSLFFVRADLHRMIPALTHLRSVLETMVLPQASRLAADKTITGKFLPSLALLLSEVLAQGSLYCFIVRAEEMLILSPGMEILLLCLAECSYFPTAEAVEKIISVSKQWQGVRPCPN